MILKIVWQNNEDRAVWTQSITVQDEKNANAYVRGSKRNTKAKVLAWTIEK